MNFKVGRIVKFFVLADLTVFGAWGFIEPIFSVYIIERIPGADLSTVGISAAIFWIVRSLLQPPIANYLDKHAGETDDFRAIILGLLLAALSAIGFIWVKAVWELYAMQFIHAAGFSLYVAAWSGIFGRHLDKDRISFDWSLDLSAVSIGTGIAGLLGSFIAVWLGFNTVFILVAFFTLAAAVFLFITPELVVPSRTLPKAMAREASLIAEDEREKAEPTP